MTALALYLLAVIGAHRLWNFETVFQGARNRLLRYSWAMPLTCQACNAFWIALALALIDRFAPAAPLLLATLAAYALARGSLWVYRMASHTESWARAASIHGANTAAPTVQAASAPVAPPVVAPATPCSDCERKKAALVEQGSDAARFSRRIVLLTTLSDFSSGYSLTSVVLDQARMLAQDPTWLVEIWVHELAALGDAPAALPPNARIRRIIPQVAWRNDVIVTADRDRLLATVRGNLLALGNATVIAHDVIFQSAYVSFAAAVHQIGAMPGFAWLHVCHSAVLGRPVGPEAITVRTSLPAGHKLLCLNAAEAPHLAEYYATDERNVLVCPNARDITAFGAFDARAATLIRTHGLADAHVVQVMPVSATRLQPKGVPVLLEVFAALHRLQFKTRLVLVTCHANAPEEKASLALLRRAAAHLGLPPETLVITSEVFPETAGEGLPATAVRDLFTASNVFVFPTISEVSSLVVVEAALAGCLLVLNESLHTMHPLLGDSATYFPFGSLRSPRSGAINADHVAALITRKLSESPTNRTKRAALARFSYSVIGERLRALVSQLPLATGKSPTG